MGFAEHHQTNHWFLSAYLLTLHSCLFWVAVFSYLKVRELPQLWRMKKKESPNWIMLKFHKNETGEAQRRLCPLPGECMSQDPFCQTQGTIRRPGYTGLIQVCFFHSHYFEDLQSQTKDTKSRRETTVLVGNTTKAVCVHWETETTMQTGLFCSGCPGASLASLPQKVISFLVMQRDVKVKCCKVDLGLWSWNWVTAEVTVTFISSK